MGTIEVITGPMFCGKSEELIRRVRRAEIAKQTVCVFKPKSDTRSKDVCTHYGLSIESIEIESPTYEILPHEKEFQVFAIDEVQFLPETIFDVVQQLRDSGKRVIVAGLDMDYSGVPFENVAQIMAVADKVKKLSAICMVCGEPATMSFRKTDEDSRVLVGDKDSYEARCRKHWDKNTTNFELEYVSEWR